MSYLWAVQLNHLGISNGCLHFVYHCVYLRVLVMIWLWQTAAVSPHSPNLSSAVQKITCGAQLDLQLVTLDSAVRFKQLEPELHGGNISGTALYPTPILCTTTNNQIDSKPLVCLSVCFVDKWCFVMSAVWLDGVPSRSFWSYDMTYIHILCTLYHTESAVITVSNPRSTFNMYVCMSENLKLLYSVYKRDSYIFLISPSCR